MNEPQNPQLPQHALERIASEEAARLRIRQELEKATSGDRADGTRFWQFLNSALGIFVLTTIFVSGIGGIFTLWQQHSKEMEARKSQALRLLAEFDFRLNEFDFRATRIAQLDDTTKQGQETIYIWRAARGNVDFQPALPEFHNVHLAGIIIQLVGLGASDGSADAIAATRVLENGNTVPVAGGFGLFPPGVLEAQRNILHHYSDTSWKIIDPSHPSGGRPF
jgi:hypothetical protein